MKIFLKNQLKTMEGTNKILFFGNIFQTIVILILAITIGTNSRTVFMVPPFLDDKITVSKNFVSPEYIRSMAVFFVDLLFDRRGGDRQVAIKTNALGYYAKPEIAKSISKQILEMEKKDIAKGTTARFDIADIKVDLDSNRVLVEGDRVDSFVSGRESRVSLFVQFNYSIVHGRLWIEGIKVLKKKEN